jgi:ribonuclease HI
MQFCGFREGLGFQTKQVAQYRALILGLKQAIKKGFKHVNVEGGPDYVINQVCLFYYRICMYYYCYYILYIFH